MNPMAKQLISIHGETYKPEYNPDKDIYEDKNPYVKHNYMIKSSSYLQDNVL